MPACVRARLLSGFVPFPVRARARLKEEEEEEEEEGTAISPWIEGRFLWIHFPHGMYK